MAKQALLVLQEAGSKQLAESKGVVEKVLAQHFPDMMFKALDYQLDHPEEVSYHVGRMVQFVARPNGKGPDPPEELTQEELTLRQQVSRFLSELKPLVIQGAKEVWYSKEDLKRIREGKATQGRISTGSVKIHERTKDQA